MYFLIRVFPTKNSKSVIILFYFCNFLWFVSIEKNMLKNKKPKFL